jgi:hypothetical protein
VVAVLTMSAQGAVRVLACALLVVGLAACGARPTDYASLADAQSAGAVSQGLLPDGLPPSTALIRVERDESSASGYFHFSSADYAPMRAGFAPLAQLPSDPVLQDWVQRKGLAGYESYSLQQRGANWLLLCAQNKGRCYFRRM